ncbi:MAG: gluconeogenesis factor YvcK family protein [bacterium]
MKRGRIKDKPIFLTWFIPGLEIKRWMFLMFLGTVFMVIGVSIFLGLRPLQYIFEFLGSIAQVSRSEITGGVVFAAGLIVFFLGWKKTNSSIINAVKPDASLLENLYVHRKLSRGPKIVAIGGGTGLSTILKGLKHITGNITAVVTVGDDGGSSGRLREEMGILPPGDIRNCIAGLARDESLVTELFQYRFKTGNGLEGHSFGNLFLSALCAITGDMVSAVKESSKVLDIRGRVLPSTLDDMKLFAELEDGRIIYGESNIPEAGGKILRLKATPEKLKALEEVIIAIQEADIILMGPGSLYTSVIPNLLIEEITEAISKSEARKIYICNIMTQPGETDNYTVSDHVQAILDHSKHKYLPDTVLVNDKLPKNLALKYKEADSFPVVLDSERLKELGVKILTKRLIEENSEGFVRHSPERIAKIISDWYKENSRKNNGAEGVEESSVETSRFS